MRVKYGLRVIKPRQGPISFVEFTGGYTVPGTLSNMVYGWLDSTSDHLIYGLQCLDRARDL
jgi:hypothetical protein